MKYTATNGLNYPVKGADVRVEAGATLSDVQAQATGKIAYIPPATAKIYLGNGNIVTEETK